LTNQSEKVNRYDVNAYAQVMPYQNIYAVGDVARMISERYPNGHPMLATVAIQQGKIVAENIIRAMNGSPLITFHYFDKGSMATVGKNKAVADFPFLKLSGFMAWFVWMFVHIVSIAGFRNRIVIFTDWIWNYITYERALRLIIRPVKKDTT
jgi:NADH dehydrogenase